MKAFCWFALLILGSCVISKTVIPVQEKTVVKVLYIEKNKNFLNSKDVIRLNKLHTAIVSECRSMGFKVIEFESVVPSAAKHILSYNATWQWDIVMFLETFEAVLFDGERRIASAKYDATRPGARLDKFGDAAAKIKPLLRLMLKDVATRITP
jgi:hypothetical protein